MSPEDVLAAFEECLSVNAKIEALVETASSGKLNFSTKHLVALEAVVQSCRRVVASHGVMLALDEMAASRGKRGVGEQTPNVEGEGTC